MVNFFYLDKDPKKCAKYYCNKHILKIPIEIAQIMQYYYTEDGKNWKRIRKVDSNIYGVYYLHTIKK